MPRLSPRLVRKSKIPMEQKSFLVDENSRTVALCKSGSLLIFTEAINNTTIKLE